MNVHIIDSGPEQDMGFKEFNVEAFKMDHIDATYAIVSNPFRPGDSLRAEYNFHNGCLQWVVDIS